MADAPTKLQTVLDGLADGDRALVTARFADLLKAVDDMRDKADEAGSQLKIVEAKLAEGTKAPNDAMLEAQIKMMAEQLNGDLRATYFCEAPQLLEELRSPDLATVRAATDRMICACNRQMMEDRARRRDVPARTTPAAKRTADALDEPDPDPVARALAETFSV
jgi:hypothetical protein